MPSKYYGSAAAIRALGEYSSPMPAAVADSLLNRKDVLERVVETTTQSMYVRSEAFYRYGQTTYIRGLPTLTGLIQNIPYTQIKAAIETEVGNPVSLLYVTAGNSWEGHEVFAHLVNVRGYNRTTGAISVYPPNLIDLITAGLEATLCTYVGFTISGTTALLEYQYNNTYPVFETIQITSINKDVYHVGYFNLNAAGNFIGEMSLWSYVLDTGKPALDNLFGLTMSTEDTGYYPIIPFYEGVVKLGDVANKNTTLYKDSKKLIKKLGASYEDMVDDLHEGTAESVGKNKGLYAYLGFFADVTLPILKDSQATAEARKLHAKAHKGSIIYLAEFFSRLTPIGVTGQEYFSFADGDGYKSLFELAAVTNVVIAYDEADGECGATFTELYSPYTVPFDYSKDVQEITTINRDVSELVYWYRVGPNLRRVVTVVGLLQYVSAHNRAAVVVSPKDSFLAEPTLLCIPLNRNLVNELLESKLRTPFMHSCLMYVFAGYVRQEIEWYQTQFFQAIVVFAALVLAVPSGGASLKTAGALLALGSYGAFVYYILLQYVNYLFIKAIAKEIIDVIGVEAAYIVAILSMAYGQFYTTNFTKNIMQLGSSLFNGANKYIQDQYKKLQKEFAEFSTESDKLQKELNDASKAIDLSKELDFDVLGSLPSRFSFGATASESLNEALRLDTNILMIEIPDIYSDLLLKLPTINETLRV